MKTKSELKKDLTWKFAQNIVQDTLLNGKSLFDIVDIEQFNKAKNNIDKIAKILNKKLTYKEASIIFNAGYRKI